MEGPGCEAAPDRSRPPRLSHGEGHQGHDVGARDARHEGLARLPRLAEERRARRLRTRRLLHARLPSLASGTSPDRVTAVAAYHPGGLATDAPDSPHTLAPKIEATLYIGGAKEDSSFDDAQKARLRKALDDAH